MLVKPYACVEIVNYEQSQQLLITSVIHCDFVMTITTLMNI